MSDLASESASTVRPPAPTTRVSEAAVPAGPGRVAADTAGLLLARLSVLPALLTLPFLLTSFPLLLLGWFKPVPVIALWLLLSAVVVPVAWRRVPSVTGAADFGTPRAGRATRTPPWVLLSVLAIAVAFGLFQAAYHSQFVIVQLDPASYMQFAQWISDHGSLPITQNADAFGNAPGVTYASPAFYQVGNSIVPQFMAGLPLLLSLGFWSGGARLAVFFGPLLGALAVLVFAGLVARLIGPRWAPLGALAIAVTIPEQYVSRGTFSEPLAQILFLGALSLWIDTQRTDRGPQDARPWRGNWRAHARSATHVLAFITGLLLGITLLVRIDGPSDILLVIPYCGLLVMQRRRQVFPLVIGTIIGLVYGVVDGAFLTLPYLKDNKSSVYPLIAAFVLVAALTLVAVLWLRRRRRRGREPIRLGPRWVKAGVAAPFVIMALFAIRPYVEKNWRELQYAPLSLHWVYWYTGGITILFGTIAAALITKRVMRGQEPVWTLPLLVFAWIIVEFLLRPAITPHQPWASRRLVPGVLPGFLLLAIWLTAWFGRRARIVRLVNVPARLERAPRVLAVAICAIAVVAPPLVGNLGLGLAGGGPIGIKVTSDGLAFTRTYVGEIAAVNKICDAIPAGSSVLIADNTMMQQFGQAIRGMCGVPVAGATPAGKLKEIPARTLIADVRAIEQAGRRPYVLAPSPDAFTPLDNGTVTYVMGQDTSIDEHVIFGTPRNPVPERFTAYSWEPAK